MDCSRVSKPPSRGVGTCECRILQAGGKFADDPLKLERGSSYKNVRILRAAWLRSFWSIPIILHSYPPDRQYVPQLEILGAGAEAREWKSGFEAIEP